MLAALGIRLRQVRRDGNVDSNVAGEPPSHRRSNRHSEVPAGGPPIPHWEFTYHGLPASEAEWGKRAPACRAGPEGAGPGHASTPTPHPPGA